MENGIVLGTFDGVHKGHRAVISLLDGYKKIAVTFKKPPKMFISGDCGLILTEKEKCRILKAVGIEEILMLDFSRVRDMSPLDFLNFLKEKYNPKLIACGFNYRFGKFGSGDTNYIKEYCTENGIIFKCCEPVQNDGKIVSSTAIRKLLKDGSIEKANSFLSENFSFTAPVISGDQRGRTIGFPTINQRYPECLVPLKFGVYKSKVTFEGKEYSGITNIGLRPTYKSDFVISETYILDFSGDLYGKSIKIEPKRFLRGEVKFSTIEELKNQIKNDIIS